MDLLLGGGPFYAAEIQATYLTFLRLLPLIVSTAKNGGTYCRIWRLQRRFLDLLCK